MEWTDGKKRLRAFQEDEWYEKSQKIRVDPSLLSGEKEWGQLCSDVFQLGELLVLSPTYSSVTIEIENGCDTNNWLADSDSFRFYALVVKNVGGSVSRDVRYGYPHGSYRSLSVCVNVVADDDDDDHTEHTALCRTLCDLADAMRRLQRSPGLDIQASQIVFNGAFLYNSRSSR